MNSFCARLASANTSKATTNCCSMSESALLCEKRLEWNSSWRRLEKTIASWPSFHHFIATSMVELVTLLRSWTKTNPWLLQWIATHSSSITSKTLLTAKTWLIAHHTFGTRLSLTLRACERSLPKTAIRTTAEAPIRTRHLSVAIIAHLWSKSQHSASVCL